MRVGSLVELIDDNWNSQRKELLTQFGVRYPVKGKVYTIRELTPTGGLLLEEVVNPPMHFTNVGVVEPGWKTFRFRELLPPISIDIEQFLSVEV